MRIITLLLILLFAVPAFSGTSTQIGGGGGGGGGPAVVSGPATPTAIVMDASGTGTLERTSCTIPSIGGIHTGISCERPAGTATAVVIETEDNTAGTPLDKRITLTAPTGVPAATASRTITAGTDLVFGFERSVIPCPDDQLTGPTAIGTYRCFVPHAGVIEAVWCNSTSLAHFNAAGGAINMARVDTSGTVHSLTNSSTQTIPGTSAAQLILPAPIGPTVALAAGEHLVIATSSPPVLGHLCVASFLSN